MQVLEDSKSLIINQIISSTLVNCFEIARESIINTVGNILCLSFDLDKMGYKKFEKCELYQNEIIKKELPPQVKKAGKEYKAYYASCLWLIEMKFITEDDFVNLQEIRKRRNVIVHDPATYLFHDYMDSNSCFVFKIQEIINKIDKKCYEDYADILFIEEFTQEELKTAKSGTKIAIDYLAGLVNLKNVEL